MVPGSNRPASEAYTCVLKSVFMSSAGGQISQVRLSPSSGNASFDRSVLAAFRMVGNVGPTPTGQGYSLTIHFELGQ